MCSVHLGTLSYHTCHDVHILMHTSMHTHVHSCTHTGRLHSDETKDKIRQKVTELWQDPNYRARTHLKPVSKETRSVNSNSSDFSHSSDKDMIPCICIACNCQSDMSMSCVHTIGPSVAVRIGATLCAIYLITSHECVVSLNMRYVCYVSLISLTAYNTGRCCLK